MEGKALFRSSLFGYNKKDVLEYLSEAAKTAQRELEAARESADYHEKDAREAHARAADAEENYNLLSGQERELRDDLSRARESADSLEKEVKRLSYELSCKRDDLNIRDNELSYSKSLNENMAKRIEELEGEVDRYIEQKVQIADALINARRMCAILIESARKEAREARIEAQRQIALLKDQYDSFCEEARLSANTARTKADGISCDLDDMLECIDSTGQRLTEVLDALLLPPEGEEQGSDVLTPYEGAPIIDDEEDTSF